MTPAESSGIGNDLGQDKWLGLIRKAQSKGESNMQENKGSQAVKERWRRMGWIEE